MLNSVTAIRAFREPARQSSALVGRGSVLMLPNPMGVAARAMFFDVLSDATPVTTKVVYVTCTGNRSIARGYVSAVRVDETGKSWVTIDWIKQVDPEITATLGERELLPLGYVTEKLEDDSVAQVNRINGRVYFDPAVAATAAQPQLGVHASAHWVIMQGVNTETTASRVVTSGSYIVAFCAVADLVPDNVANPPTDSKSNVFEKIGADVNYSPEFTAGGISTYGCAGVTGGNGYTMTKTGGYTEATFSFVEVLGGTSVDGTVQIAQGSNTPSITITSTGPAILIAVFNGWQYETSAPSVSAGWTIVEDYYATATAIQQTVAIREVSSAGTYTCTFTITPTQKANLIGVAIK